MFLGVVQVASHNAGQTRGASEWPTSSKQAANRWQTSGKRVARFDDGRPLRRPSREEAPSLGTGETDHRAYPLRRHCPGKPRHRQPEAAERALGGRGEDPGRWQAATVDW